MKPAGTDMRSTGVHTAEELHRRHRRPEQRKRAVAKTLAAMESGAVLRLRYENGVAHWRLSPGAAVVDEVARVVIDRSEIISNEDALFPGMAQTWRHAQPTPPAPARATYELLLQPLPGIDGIRALRIALKALRRGYGLKCLSITEIREPTARSGAAVQRTSEARRKQRTTKMDVSQYMGSTFVKTEDLSDGPREVEIADCTPGRYDKLDLTFADGDRLSLNATNLRTLVRAFGKDTDNWKKKSIELFIGKTEFKGEPQDSVLVRPILPAATNVTTSSNTAPAKRINLDEEIPF